MCDQFYGKAYGVCRQVAQEAKNLSNLPEGAVAVDGRVDRVPVERGSPKFKHAYDFWFIFFEVNCQKPNSETRLWPVDKSIRQIYREYFVAYLKALKVPTEHWCCLEWFRQARKEPEFKDVKRRKEHWHCKCHKCSVLKKQMLNCFKDGLSLTEYKRARDAHDCSVKAWRRLESVMQAKGQHTPGEWLVFSYDDTTAKGFPHFGKREPKGVSKTRFELIPWLVQDWAVRSRQDYVYTPVGRWGKGANRHLTMLHAVLRRAKSNYGHPSYVARKLCLIADNYQENKNNVLFAYCTDLIQNHWFDEVILIFGEVGHTHNGVDATHRTHNESMGIYCAACFGEWVNNYPKCFHNPDRRPGVSVVDVVLDWTNYYSNYMHPLSGFTNTMADPNYVRGFKFFRNENGAVELKFQKDPGLEGDNWRGVDGLVGNSGFFVLRGKVPNVPGLQDPASAPVKTMTYLNQMKNKIMKEQMSAEQMPEAIEFNFQCAHDGRLPYTEVDFLEQSIPSGEWGRLCKVGCKKQAQVRIIDMASLVEPGLGLWDLPRGNEGQHLLAKSPSLHISEARLREFPQSEIPLVRYKKPEDNRAAAEANARKRANEQKQPNEAVADVADNENAEPLQVEEEIGHVDDNEGSWYMAADGQRLFKIAFRPVISEYCVGKATYDAPESGDEKKPGIFVGKITSIDENSESVEVTDLLCTVSPWLPECVKKQWFMHKKPTKGVVSNEQMLAYFPSLTKAKRGKNRKSKSSDKLPAEVQALIARHSIWPADASEESSSSDDAPKNRRDRRQNTRKA